jgi:hypothetical protein
MPYVSGIKSKVKSSKVPDHLALVLQVGFSFGIHTGSASVIPVI